MVCPADTANATLDEIRAEAPMRPPKIDKYDCLLIEKLREASQIRRTAHGWQCIDFNDPLIARKWHGGL